MTATFTLYILWAANVPNITFKIVCLGLTVDAASAFIKWIVGLKGEQR